jgi:penicillin-binding protein 1A
MKKIKDILHKTPLPAKWQALKTAVYPYLQPYFERYRAYEARRPRRAKALLIGGSVVAGGFACAFLFWLLIILGVFGRMPSRADLRNLNQNIASEVYSQDSVLLGKYFIENRLPADLEDISPFVIDALISTEDARFFEHGGIDFRAAFRVLFRTILQGDESSGGGSTLSQQLAKNLYPRKKLGFLTMPVAKIKEMIIAKRLESVYNKTQLLALYLNTVPFGENAFGIRIAAERYFDTTPKDLKIEEAATLVGMLKAPTAYNPSRNPERSKERRNTVLAQMVKYKKIDQATCDSIKQLPIVLKYHYESHNEGLATYFREHLRLELEAALKKFSHPDGRPFNLYTDGLKIYTTINAKMQQYAEEAVREQMKEVQKSFIDHFRGYSDALPWGSNDLLEQQKKATRRYQHLKERGLTEADIDSNFNTPIAMTVFSWETETQDKDTTMTPLDSLKYYLSLLNTGLLATDPRTGKVMAWVGGINFKHFKYDHVKALRQVGSTFKPVVYAKALEAGVPPCERFPNDFIVYPEYDNWSPRNADGVYGGTYSMRGAVRLSVNTVAVQLIMRVGIDSVMNLAKQMGIASKIPHEPGIALGSLDATLLEMVRLFSVFCNRGVVPQLYSLTRIETTDGRRIAEFAPPNPVTFPRVLRQEVADQVRYLLQSVVDGGTGGRLRYQNNFIYPAAGKTGTTDNNSDGWFIGFTPDVVVGAWVGAEQPLVRWRSTRLGQGGATALPVCGRFLAKVYADPAFKTWQKNNFPPLTGTPAGSFDCPDYLPHQNMLLDSLQKLLNMDPDSIDPYVRDSLVEKIRTLLRLSGYTEEPEEASGENLDDGENNQGEEEQTSATKRRTVRNEELAKESERIKKKDERLERKRERRKKRKEFFDDLLGKKN